VAALRARHALDRQTGHGAAAPAPAMSLGPAGGQRRSKSLTADLIDR
jgi:hypothetical protein